MAHSRQWPPCKQNLTIISQQKLDSLTFERDFFLALLYNTSDNSTYNALKLAITTPRTKENKNQRRYEMLQTVTTKHPQPTQ